jgi:hypothetical protein
MEHEIRWVKESNLPLLSLPQIAQPGTRLQLEQA